MANDWKENLKIAEDKEEKRILELQNKIKANELSEEDLSEEDKQKVRMLYYRQNEALREKLKQYKKEIGKLLKK